MRAIRRSDREISIKESKTLLDSAEYGILSTVDIDGQPYGIPLSFVYKNECIYFHCAVSGQKLDNMKFNAKVSFCVIGNTKVLPDKFATEYESTVIFGVASKVSGTERHDALLWLLEKYCPDYIEEGKLYIDKQDNATMVYKIEISHISGKARR